jgi:uncharacterized protein (DUF433 family)
MAQRAPDVETHPERQGGEPCLAGTRVRVRSIGEVVESGTYTPEEAAAAKDVSLPDVHRALAYYYDHPDEMERYADRQRERERRSLDAGADTIADLRRERTADDGPDG